MKRASIADSSNVPGSLRLALTLAVISSEEVARRVGIPLYRVRAIRYGRLEPRPDEAVRLRAAIEGVAQRPIVGSLYVRYLRGFSLRRLARETSIPLTTLHRYEKGRARLPRDREEQIRGALERLSKEAGR